MTPALPMDIAEASDEPAPDTAPLMVETPLRKLQNKTKKGQQLEHLRSNSCLDDS